MPRISRKSFETSFFHVMVQGLKKEYIFEDKIAIKKYIELILKEQEKFDLEILAYCIMNNHAHLLIYTEKISEMSEYMHLINLKFAQFYNHIKQGRVGYVFRDRYKSEPIFNEKYLLKCVRYIHNNPVKAKIVKYAKDYKYSSYNDYLNKKGVSQSEIIKEIIDFEEILSEDYIETKLDNIFLDTEESEQELIQTKILEYEIENKISLVDLRKNSDLLTDLVEEIKNNYKISYRSIVKEIGISESKWKRIKRGSKK